MVRQPWIRIAASATPTDPVAGYVNWYDASDTGSITHSSGSVSQWNDKSGNARHLTQATGSNQPTTGTRTQNGRNVIDFDGSDDYMQTGNFSVSQPGTVFIVALSDVTNASKNMIDGASDRWHIDYHSSGVHAWGAPTDTNSSESTDTNAHVFSAVINNSANTLYRDGVALTIAAPGSGSLSGGLYVGTFNTSAAMWNGWIAEILIYASAFNATDRQLNEAYLKAKWGTP